MKNKLRAALICILLAVSFSLGVAGASSQANQLQSVALPENALYNGIVIPEGYELAADYHNGYAPVIPYLLDASEGGYKPETVNIDVGRQLFVDDFLIQSTTLKQTYHKAKTYDEPVFSVKDTNISNGTAATSGGIWYDMDAKLYKIWYGAGFGQYVSYAYSENGLDHWQLPSVNEQGTNVVITEHKSDSCSIWIDYDAPKAERYKMMIRQVNRDTDGDGKVEGTLPAQLYTSSNGIFWLKKGETGTMGDRSTFFRNWFTKDWVFSIRHHTISKWGEDFNYRRTRYYHADQDWLKAAKWDWTTDDAPDFWLKTDALDPIDTTQPGNNIPQLYNFDSIAYESLMIGMFEIWYGPENDYIYSEDVLTPKITELQASYSRDGFHYDRPVRGVGEALISASRQMGDWDYGYLQSATGGLIVYDDEIRIYYSAFSGIHTTPSGYESRDPGYGGAVGVATLRRDGFASMDGTGELTTVPLTATKQVKYLFVNANVKNGSLRAEVLDPEGNVVSGYSAAECNAMSADDCCYRLSWNGSNDLSFLRGKGFRLRFVMENGELYSFWLSADPEGASGGAVGAGYAGEKDLDPEIAPEPVPSETESIPAEQEKKRGCSSSAEGVMACLLSFSGCLMVRRRRNSRRLHCRPQFSLATIKGE